MVRAKFVWSVLIAVAAIVVVAVSYWYGAYAQRRAEDRNLADAQATLAFGHYKSYEGIESLLLRECYEAALTEIRGLKNLQITLVSDNLRRTGNDPELLEYIKVRDPKARNRNGGPSPRVDTVHNHLPLA